MWVCACEAKLDWAKLTNEDVLLYGKTDVLLSSVYLPKSAMCSNVNRFDTAHREACCAMYDCIVGAM